MTGAAQPRRWPLALAVFGAWVAIGLVSASLTYSTWQGERVNATLGHALLLIAPYWVYWALVTPLIAWLVRRAPLHEGRLPRAVLIHVTACLVIGTAHVTLYMLANLYFFPWPARERIPSFATLFTSYLRTRWQFEVLIYVMIVGATQALMYYRGMQERTVRATQLESQLAQSQLQALRMQLHPHFLFNTLQAISVLTVENPRAAQKMLTQLGDLLRAVLDGDERQEVPLYQELEFLTQYLAIEQVRFPDRLTVSFAVDEAVRDALVPSFVLQPLVENAVRYAIAPSAGPGHVEIAARAEGSQLVLAVRDSGPGFAEPVVEGVGIATTRARVEKMYGGAHGLSLGRSAQGGAEATIALPLRRDAGEA